MNLGDRWARFTGGLRDSVEDRLARRVEDAEPVDENEGEAKETKEQKSYIPRDWREQVDALFSNQVFSEIYGVVLKKAGEGKESVRESVRTMGEKYNAKLDDMLETSPKLAGGIDGFTEAFTTDAVNRSRKRDYEQGVGIGKVVGYATSVATVFTGSFLLIAATAVPYLSRHGGEVVGYVKEKVAEAQSAKKEGEM